MLLVAMLVATVSTTMPLASAPAGSASAQDVPLVPDRAALRYVSPSSIELVPRQEALLKASNAGVQDIFGIAVAVDGDTLAVGADSEDSAATGTNGDQNDGGAIDSGAVYVFVRDGASWSQQAYLKASNTGFTDYFGASLALSGDTLVVGAWREDSSATGVDGDQTDDGAIDSGAVYVFVRDGTSWSQQAYLKASNTGAGDRFGWSVAIAGDTVVVGAQEEDSAATGVGGDQASNGAMASGAAYVFVRDGTSWSQQAYLKASNTGAGDRFGQAVDLSGELAVIGAHQEDSAATGVNGDQAGNAAQESGAAYVFERDGSTWSQAAYLKASNPERFDSFGSSVAVSGDTIVAGADGEDSAATGVDGDQASNAAPTSGAAYVFVREGSTWSQGAYLKASNTGAVDRFGTAVAVAGDVVVVGARSEDSSASGIDGDGSDDGAPDAGAAYVFAREAGSWSQTAYVKASDTDAGDQLGRSVSLSDGAIVVGAPTEDDLALDAGAAYVYRLGLPGAVAFRNAGANPTSYAAGPIETGGAFTATVDNNVAGQLGSLLFAFEAQVAVPLANGATLLCLDLGSGELFTGANLAPTSSAGGVDGYDFLVPDEPALVGLCFSSQAIQLGNPPFALSNAQDFTVGGF